MQKPKCCASILKTSKQRSLANSARSSEATKRKTTNARLSLQHIDKLDEASTKEAWPFIGLCSRHCGSRSGDRYHRRNSKQSRVARLSSLAPRSHQQLQ